VSWVDSAYVGEVPEYGEAGVCMVKALVWFWIIDETYVY